MRRRLTKNRIYTTSRALHSYCHSLGMDPTKELNVLSYLGTIVRKMFFSPSKEKSHYQYRKATVIK